MRQDEARFKAVSDMEVKRFDAKQAQISAQMKAQLERVKAMVDLPKNKDKKERCVIYIKLCC